MLLLLAIPLWCGFELARRVVREPSRRGQWVIGIALAISLTLLGVNGVYRLANLDLAVGSTLAAEFLLTLALLRLPKPEAEATWSWSALTWISLVVIYLFTASQQIANPDDDYWIHTPLQGLMLHGNFPPFNPFFSEIPMNGHYGRNLSLVTLSYLSGVDIFLSQHLTTCVVQLLTYLVFLLALERHSGSRAQALLGVTLMYFGINVGGRGGLMDTLQNNNPYVHLYLALCLHLTLTLWRSANKSPWALAILAGAVLGGYSIVYETHFGLTVLAILSTLPLAWLARWDFKKTLVTTGLLLAVAVPLAATQGGPITNIFQRKLSGQKEVVAESLSKGMQNQAQVVKLTFPKHDLFQILLERGEYQRISCVYIFDDWLHHLYTASPGRGYAYIFSWDVLKLHFLPLYLAPWTGWFLWRRRNLGGFFLWTWGVISFLVPAVVDFGPIYESEYFRWEFAAGLGLAGGLGVALGEIWDDSRKQLDWTYEVLPGGLLLDIRKGGWQQLAIALVVYLDTLVCAHLIGNRAIELADSGHIWQRAVALPSSSEWLRSHAVLDFEPIDWRAARWLETQVQPGQRLLTNFRQENNFSILFESTLTGVCGARCVGHALPLDDEAIGTTPFHQAAPAAAFWKTGDRIFLDQLMVDWIYYRPTPEQPELKVEGLEEVHREGGGGDHEERLIYRYRRRPYEMPAKPGTLPPALKLTQVELPDALRGGQYAPLKLHFAPFGTLPEGARVACVPIQIPSKKSPADVELVQVPLTGPTMDVPWVAPVEEGRYDLRFLYQDKQGQAWIPSPGSPSYEVELDFSKWLKELHLENTDIPATGRTGDLIQAKFQLHPMNPKNYPDLSVLASLAPVVLDGEGPIPEELHRGELRGDLYQLPGIDMQSVTLQTKQGGYTITVAGILPKVAGHYRIDLFLSPEQGKLFRYPGSEIEVKP